MSVVAPRNVLLQAADCSTLVSVFELLTPQGIAAVALWAHLAPHKPLENMIP